MNKKISYTKKTQVALTIFFAVFSFLLVESVYLSHDKSRSSQVLEKKLAFVKMSGLPDLAISTEANYIRHRSLSDIFSLYKDDGTLREYFPSTYAISYSRIANFNK